MWNWPHGRVSLLKEIWISTCFSYQVNKGDEQQILPMFSDPAVSVPQSPPCWNTWLFNGGCKRSTGQTCCFLIPSPRVTPSFVPWTTTLLRFLAPFRSSVNEYLNYMGSKEWSWPRVHVNAFICACVRARVCWSIFLIEKRHSCSCAAADWSSIEHLDDC